MTGRTTLLVCMTGALALACADPQPAQPDPEPRPIVTQPAAPFDLTGSHILFAESPDSDSQDPLAILLITDDDVGCDVLTGAPADDLLAGRVQVTAGAEFILQDHCFYWCGDGIFGDPYRDDEWSSTNGNLTLMAIQDRVALPDALSPELDIEEDDRSDRTLSGSFDSNWWSGPFEAKWCEPFGEGPLTDTQPGVPFATWDPVDSGGTVTFGFDDLDTQPGFFLGIAETAAGSDGWYGEDCLENECHEFATPAAVLTYVDSVDDVVYGTTTLFDGGSGGGDQHHAYAADGSDRLTYILQFIGGPNDAQCFVWGDDPSYYGHEGCTVL